ncbi:MAG: glycosyltransferase family 39 protein [Candidatus Firestonebacteria bacterium]|mgnify:CR=1 FL=1
MLYFVLIIGFIIRLFYAVVLVPQDIVGDAFEYDTIAVNIVQGNGFSMDSCNPTAIRGPVYPYLIATIYKIFGHSYLAVRMFQVLISVLSCFLVYKISKAIFEITENANYTEKIAIASSFLFALYPSFIIYTGMIYTETLFIFLLLFSMFCLIQVFKADKFWLWMILSGISLGFTSLCRTTTILFPIFLIAIIYLYNLFKKDLVFKKVILMKILLVFILSILTIVPWTIRNDVAFKKFIPVMTRVGQNLWGGNYIPYDGYWDVWTNKVSREEFTNTMNTITKGYYGIDADEILLREGIKNIIQNPWGTFLLGLKKMYRFWIFPVGSGFIAEKGLSLLSKIIMIPHIIILIFGGIGMYFGMCKNKLSMLLVAIIFYYTFAHTVFLVVPRYHLPIMPYVLIFAVYGVYKIIKIKSPLPPFIKGA